MPQPIVGFMGWARGTDALGREVGYAVEAVCDEPECSTMIYRHVESYCGGLSNDHGQGCALNFCEAHLDFEYAEPDEDGEEEPATDMLCPACLGKWISANPVLTAL